MGLFLASFLWGFASVCLCEEYTPSVFRIPPDASDYEIAVSPNGPRIGPFAVYFESAGLSSVAVEVGIEGPTGLRGAPFGVQGPAGQGEFAEYIVPFDLHDRMNIYEAGPPGTSRYDSFAINGETPRGLIRFLYQLQKDACAVERDAMYLTGVWFEPSGVAAELLQKGFSVHIAMRERPFEGARVASINPTAEGKYRGEPILLMGSMQYGGEHVNLVRRSREGARTVRRLPVVKYVWHRGYSLSLARLRGVLRGGRATFELTNGGEIYGVCFELRRRRQVVNGYPLRF